MGLMTYGAQIAAGVGSLWTNCRHPQGFANTTLWRHESYLVNVNGCRFITKKNYLWPQTYILFPFLNIIIFDTAVLCKISPVAYVRSPTITRNFASICSHHKYNLFLSAHSVRPDFSRRLAIIFSWTVTDYFTLVLALQHWKVELMGFQLLYCECRLLRGKRYDQIWLAAHSSRKKTAL